MILSIRKDLNSVIYCEVIYCEVIYCRWLFIHLKQCLPKLTRLLCHCFVNSAFRQKTNFAIINIYTVEVLKFMEKKGRQMKYFQKFYMACSKLTSQRTLQINNIHLDHGCCWQQIICKKQKKNCISFQKE